MTVNVSFVIHMFDLMSLSVFVMNAIMEVLREDVSFAEHLAFPMRIIAVNVHFKKKIEMDAQK